MVKYNFYIVNIFLLLFSIGCTEVYFEKPQPTNVNKINYFPDRLLGSYVTDGDTIFIAKTAYYSPEIFRKTIPMKKLKSSSKISIKDGLLYDEDLPINKGVNYTIKNDTLGYQVKINIPKTLSEDLILKQFGKYLVLNEKEEKYWNTYLIRPISNGNLKIFTVGDFISEEENTRKLKYDGVIKDFFPITTFKKIDKNTYLLNPTAKEFEKLIKKGLFVEKMELKKVSSKAKE